MSSQPTDTLLHTKLMGVAILAALVFSPPSTPAPAFLTVSDWICAACVVINLCSVLREVLPAALLLLTSHVCTLRVDPYCETEFNAEQNNSRYVALSSELNWTCHPSLCSAFVFTALCAVCSTSLTSPVNKSELKFLQADFNMRAEQNENDFQQPGHIFIQTIIPKKKRNLRKTR